MKQAQIVALARRNARKAPVQAHEGRNPGHTPEGRPFTSEALLTSNGYQKGFRAWERAQTRERYA